MNMLVETSRGDSRHGSVGMGFGETIERSERGFGICCSDILDPNIEERVREVRDVWFDERLNEHGLIRKSHPEVYSSDTYRHFMQDDVLDLFLSHWIDFIKSVAIHKFDEYREFFDHLVFEGAQGLALDMDTGFFPHVTRSNCGLKNVRKLVPDEVLNVYYVTRSYTTRHGAGPLPYEAVGVVSVDCKLGKIYENVIISLYSTHKAKG